MLSTIKITILVILLIIGIGWIIVHYMAPYAIIKPMRYPKLSWKDVYPKGVLPSDYGFKYEELAITTYDTLQLKAYYIPSSSDSTFATIIFLHGIGSSKEVFLGRAMDLSKQGFNIFLYDARAHGESEGQYCSFGYHEKKDVSSIIDFLVEYKAAKKIGVFGASMGAATAIQALESDQRLQFGILESTFSDLRKVVFDYKKLWTGVGIQWMANSALDRAEKIANFDAEQVKPGESAKNIHQPILYAHGDLDANISIEYGKEIFQNLASKDKEFYTVVGADHHNVGYIGGAVYYEKILSFLKRQ